MSEQSSFDSDKAHRHFSADCFNKAWDLIDKPNRTPEEDEEMVRLNQASLWHWTQRRDCNRSNLSIGYWQASRIHAILGRAEEARRYGQLCLGCSQNESAFLLAYALEALARAETVAGDTAKAGEYRAEAVKVAAAVTEDEDRMLLLKDLETLL